MSGIIIDNKNTAKLYEFLEKEILPNSNVSLLLKALTLSAFEVLEQSLAKSNTQVILATNSTPLVQRIGSEAGEEKLLNRLNQKDLAQRLLKWLQSNAQVKGIPNL